MGARITKALKAIGTGFPHREHRSKKGRKKQKDYKTGRIALYKKQKEKLKKQKYEDRNTFI